MIAVAVVAMMVLDWSLSVDERRHGIPYPPHSVARTLAMLAVAVFGWMLAA